MNLVTLLDSKFEIYWENLWHNSEIMHSLHSSRMFEFYKNYDNTYYQDRSIILLEKNVEVIGVRITKKLIDKNISVFSYYQLPVIFLENKSVDYKLRKKAFLILKDYLEDLFHEVESWEWEHLDYIFNRELSILSNYFLIEKQAKPIVNATRVLDLNLDEEKIFKNYSKGFKYNIKWGIKNLNSKIITGDDFDNKLLKEFIELHFNAAGRKTRSKNSWEILKNIVNEDKGFVSIALINHSLVSASFFSMSERHCFYGVSASNRDMFEKPISHIVLWNAIKYAKKSGCEVFELGGLSFPFNVPTPSKKEMNISFFKKNFGNKTNVYLKLKASSHNRISI